MGRKPRLIVEMPPRHGKSELTSHYGPTWYFNTWPDKRIILTSYEASFAASWGRKVRNTIRRNEDELDISLSDDSTAANIWELAEGGGLVTAGVGGAITGRGADLLVIDDPVKNADEANSLTYRERAWEWLTSTALTRLEPGAAVILVMTRWHEDDLAGRLLDGQNDEHWDEVRLPAIAEAGDQLGRTEGEALWPWRYDEKALAVIKSSTRGWWSALYQQRPTPKEGNLVHDDYWGVYDELPHVRKLVVAWDTAFKTGQHNDYSVGAVWALCRTGYYLVDIVRDRMEFPALVGAVLKTHKKHLGKPLHLVEDAASGQSLIQVLKRNALVEGLDDEDAEKISRIVSRSQLNGDAWSIVPCKAIKVDKDKYTRFSAVSHLIEGGRCYVPDRAPWLREFLDEHSKFPQATHDDMVDTTTIALTYLSAREPGDDAPLVYSEKKVSLWRE